MSEALKFNGEELKETRATIAFKEELKKLEKSVDKKEIIKDIQMNIVKDFLSKNKGKERSYWTSAEGNAEGRSGKIVTAIQIALKDFGFNPGIIDGKFGPKTKGALDAFKKIAKITEDNIGSKTVQKIIENIEAPKEKKITRLDATPRLGADNTSSKKENNKVIQKKEEPTKKVEEVVIKPNTEVSKEKFNNNIYLNVLRNIGKIDLLQEFKGDKSLLKYIKENKVYKDTSNPYFFIMETDNKGYSSELGRINIRTVIKDGQFQKTEYINQVKEIIRNKDKEKKFVNTIKNKSYTLDSLGFSEKEKGNLSIQAYMEKIDNGILNFSNSKINKKDSSYLHLELTTNELQNIFWNIKIDDFSTTKGSYEFNETKFKQWIKKNIIFLANKENPLT